MIGKRLIHTLLSLIFWVSIISQIVFAEPLTGVWKAHKIQIQKLLNNTRDTAYESINNKIQLMEETLDGYEVLLENNGEKIIPRQCFGIESYKTKEVCSGHGECTFINHCKCIKGYYGEKCENQKGKIMIYGSQELGVADIPKPRKVISGKNITLISKTNNQNSAQGIGYFSVTDQKLYASGRSTQGDFFNVGPSVYPQLDEIPISTIGGNAGITTDIIEVRVGFGKAFVIDASGDAYCIGNNPSATCGLPLPTYPTTITSLTKVPIQKPLLKLADHLYQFGVIAENSFFLGGFNSEGKLGVGNTTPRDNYTEYHVDIKLLTTSNEVNFYITSDGFGYSAGKCYYNYTGRSCVGTEGHYFEPISIPSKLNYITLDEQSYIGLAIDENNRLWAWGRNNENMFGTSKPLSNLPFIMDEDTVQVAIGKRHILKISQNGGVYCRGYNLAGQCGWNDPSLTTFNENFRLVKYLPSNTIPTQLLATYEGSFAKFDNGDVYGWGDNNYNIMGIPSSSKLYQPLPSLEDFYVKQYKVTNMQIFALTLDGTLVGGGSNVYSVFTGATDILSLMTLSEDHTIQSFVAGNGGFQALTSENILISRGVNIYGEIGDGTTNIASTLISFNQSGDWNSNMPVKRMVGCKNFYGFITQDNKFYASGVDNGRYDTHLSTAIIVKKRWIPHGVAQPMQIQVLDAAVEPYGLYVLTQNQMLYASGIYTINTNGLGNEANAIYTNTTMKIIETNLTTVSSSPFKQIVTADSFSLLLLTEDGRLYSTNLKAFYEYAPCFFCEFFQPEYLALQGMITSISASADNSFVVQTFNGSSYHYLGTTNVNYPFAEVYKFTQQSNLLGTASNQYASLYFKSELG